MERPLLKFEDESVEVIDQFLTFLYSGKLEGNAMEEDEWCRCH